MVNGFLSSLSNYLNLGVIKRQNRFDMFFMPLVGFVFETPSRILFQALLLAKSEIGIEYATCKHVVLEFFCPMPGILLHVFWLFFFFNMIKNRWHDESLLGKNFLELCLQEI